MSHTAYLPAGGRFFFRIDLESFPCILYRVTHLNRHHDDTIH